MAAKKTPSFEDRLRRLQEVVAALENGELPLEDSVRLYKEGLTLSRSCREQLEKARNEVRLLTEEGLEPFDEKKLDEEGNRTGGGNFCKKSSLPPSPAKLRPMGSPRSRNAAGRKPDNHEDWRKRYKAPASGDKPEGTDKRPLLCSSFSSSRVPDPCPRCPQTPWNQRTEDTGSDADAFMPSG